MRKWRVGTFTMSLLLIAVGVVLLIGEIKGFSGLDKIIVWWPIILIILGLEVLLNVVLSKNEHSQIKFDGFSIFMIIIIVIFSFVAYGFNHVVVKKEFRNFGFMVGSSKYESNFKKNFTVDGKEVKEFYLENQYGDVKFQKSNSSNIEIEAKIKVHNNDENYSKKYCDSLINISKGKIVKVQSDLKSYNRNKINDISIEYLVNLPDKLISKIKTSYGNVNVENIIGNLTLENQNGNSNFLNIDGELSITNSYGEVKVKEVNKNVKIENQNGKVTAEKIQGDLSVSNSYDNVQVKDVKGKLTLINTNGNVEIANVLSSANIDNKYGNVKLTDIKGDLNIKGGNSEINLKNLIGKLIIENEYGGISIEEAYGDIEIGNKNGNVELKNRNIIKNNLNINNEYGAINLTLPRKQEGHFKVETLYGDIDSDFNFNINEETEQSTKKLIDKVIGNSNVILDLKNTNDNIKVKAIE